MSPHSAGPEKHVPSLRETCPLTQLVLRNICSPHTNHMPHFSLSRKNNANANFNYLLPNSDTVLSSQFRTNQLHIYLHNILTSKQLNTADIAQNTKMFYWPV